MKSGGGYQSHDDPAHRQRAGRKATQRRDAPYRCDSQCAPGLRPKPRNHTIAVAALFPGWHFYEESQYAAKVFEPAGSTSANDPLQLYFTPHTSKPKLVVHSHATYPRRPFIHHVLDRAASR